MALSLYKIKKWTKMITGQSILHVNQGIGKYYKKDYIAGYYNDLTEKVLKDSTTLDGELPKYPGDDGISKIFPIGIFQYGLGAYDLYLATNDEKYLKKFKLCVDWTTNNQDKNGGWKTFEYEMPDKPYSSMAQGEAISLLVRAYIFYNDDKYLPLIKKGIGFLMTSVDNGGVALFKDNNVYLKEFVDRPVVLNGWIFTIFGLYDFLLIEPGNKSVTAFYNTTINTIINTLHEYDLGFWSKYDLDGKIASPFYHRLHISQLHALYDLTNNDAFKEYENLFNKYNNNKIYKIKAFILKAIQKIKE